ncbi:OR4S2 protein, partial [Crocuta crocuta]
MLWYHMPKSNCPYFLPVGEVTLHFPLVCFLISMENNVTEFIFVGLSQNEKVQQLCFFLFLLFYVILMTGNFLIIMTVQRSPNLNSPMYFFLSFLSFVDICYSSVTAPKMIIDSQAKVKSISFGGCMAQLFFCHLFGCTEIFILTAMAYDRYVAICKPLRYMTIMDLKVCSLLVMTCWLGGFTHSFVQTMLTVRLPFCGPNLIDHYFCDVHPLLKLACTETYMVGLIVIANSGMISLSCFIILMGSYTVILLSFKTRSSEGRRKALSTCASHITVVILFFIPCLFIYLRPSTTFTEDKMVAVFYTIITPMLNPLIYTLRNMEVKNAMKRLWIEWLLDRNKRDSGVKLNGIGIACTVPVSKRVATDKSVIIS